MPTSTSWWTVFAVYDDTQEPFVFHTQAEDVDVAWKRALAQADSPIHKAGIVPGKVDPVDSEDDGIVPIRGKGHAIKVTRVVVTEKRVIVPMRCPSCKADTRRANALTERSLVERMWPGHLSSNGRDIAGERGGRPTDGNTIAETMRIVCARCAHHIWDGLSHV